MNMESVFRWTGKALNGALDFTIPPRCALCLQPNDNGFCQRCQPLLPWIDIPCERCGQPVGTPSICGECQKKAIRHHRSVIPFRYEDPIASFIHQFKYQDRLSHGSALADMLAMQVMGSDRPLPDALIPVPLHLQRLRSRGFNQAALIAYRLGRQLTIPVDLSLVTRIKATDSQTHLDPMARRRNLRDAFRVNASGKYNSVAIIDDVVTTGATVDAMCTELRSHQHHYIEVWAIAKTS